MRAVVTMALFLLAVAPLPAQQRRQSVTNPGALCGEKSKGVSDFYYEAALKDITPPDWARSLIRISVGGEIKLDLWTNGDKFVLWTNTSAKNVGDFLNGLDESCHLPPDPADAVALMKVKWESKQLSPDQFAQLHRDFTTALSQYVAKMQNRYTSMIETHTSVTHLDAEGYSIVYDNSHEHVELFAWNENDDHPPNPMITWTHQLLRLAEDSFHRPFGPRARK